MKKAIQGRLGRKNIPSGVAAILRERREMCREHQKRRRRWISAAQDVAERAKSSNARAVVRFLKKYSIAGRVDPSSEPGVGFIQCQESRMKNPILFVVPNAGEQCLRKKGPYGTFFRSMNVLAIPNEPLSSFTRGMITLHEGQHAVWAHKKGRKISKGADQGVKDLWHAIDEYYAQELELEILFRIGGERFQRIISEACEVYVREIHAEPDDGFIFPSPRNFLKELTEIFGRSLSERENALRDTWVFRGAVNMFFDHFYSNDPEAAFEMKVIAVAARYEE